MLLSSKSQFLRLSRKYSGEVGPGLVASLLLHGLAAALILFFLMRTQQTKPVDLTVVPVDVVRLGNETESPPAQQRSAVPQQKAEYRKQEAASPNPPMGEAPARRPPPVDTLDARLRALARLKQPETNLRIVETPAASDATAESDDATPGDEASYAVRDFVRAQVERRWNLNLHMLGGKNFVIPIHVVITANGVVKKAEIVDRARFVNDAAYHAIALSARNAVLLASPIALPSGTYRETMDLTLNFNPKDTLQ